MSSTDKHIVCCRHFVGEFREVLKRVSSEKIEVITFPALCTGSSHLEGFKNILSRESTSEATSHMIKCSCTKSLKAELHESQFLSFTDLETCFALFLPQVTIDHFVAKHYYIITPGWLVQWKKQMTEWGFDKTTANQFFSEFAGKILLLDTQIYDNAEEKLKEFCQYVGLSYEILPVGLDYASEILEKRLKEWEKTQLKEEQDLQAKELNSRIADYSMAFDLLGETLNIETRDGVIDQISSMFQMLFAANSAVYLQPEAVKNGEFDSVPLSNDVDLPTLVQNAVENSSVSLNGNIAFTIPESKSGPAVMVVSGMAFPEFEKKYKNLALSLSEAVALAVTKATAIEKLNISQAEVIAANKELEMFNYAVSHDLKAPVRQMVGFSEILLNNFKDDLGEDAKQMIQYIGKAGSNINAIIDSLLQLSRVSNKLVKIEDYDLSSNVTRVLNQVHSAEPDRELVANVEKDVIVKGDTGLLNILLDNMIGNAWKYSSKKPVTEISFGTRKDGDQTVYFIKDSGDGFDPKHADRLFMPFQRLHKTKEFKGTGIGLSTVAKIIKRHNGCIWAESDPGEGATFYFTLGNN